MKLCKDCKHFEQSLLIGSGYRFCNHEGAARNPVSGVAFCDFERSPIGKCGTLGDLFEEKPKRVGFLKRIFG